jgi:hypothetical protein
MSMATRASIAMLVAAAAVLAARPASAKVYTEVRPRLSLLGGLDDNVPLDGTGGDYFGRAQPGLRVDIYGEHKMHVDFDCQASLARLGHPDRFREVSGSDFATGEQCAVGYKENLSNRLQVRVQSRAGYMQDPLAISGLGLLLRPGQTHVFQGRLSGEAQLNVSPRSMWTFGVDSQALTFGANDPGNGSYVGPYATYAYLTTPYSRWEVTGREQLFFSFGADPSPLAPAGVQGGLLTEAHSAMGGYVRRLSAVTTVTARAGASYVTGNTAGLFEPVARFELESMLRNWGAHLIVMHDLSIGATRAGALGLDIAEADLLGKLGNFESHLRAGVYRNTAVGNFWQRGALGYGTELDVDYHIAKEWTVGLAAARDARLTDIDVGQQVDRDVVQLRVTWERARN